jgi:hypothetical protein
VRGGWTAVLGHRDGEVRAGGGHALDRHAVREFEDVRVLYVFSLKNIILQEPLPKKRNKTNQRDCLFISLSILLNEDKRAGLESLEDLNDALEATEVDGDEHEAAETADAAADAHDEAHHARSEEAAEQRQRVQREGPAAHRRRQVRVGVGLVPPVPGRSIGRLGLGHYRDRYRELSAIEHLKMRIHQRILKREGEREREVCEREGEMEREE